MTRPTLRRLSVLTALAVLAGVWAAGAAAAPSEKDLEKIKVGMARAAVEKILGKPKRNEEVKDEGELCRLYVYRKVGRYKIVNVWFDCDDKVRAVDKAR